LREIRVAGSHYAFNDFELDTAGRELRENGIPVELAASAFDCLVYLIANRDRAIGRDELISAVWGCVGTSDTTLAHTLVRLRRLLGDAGSEQHTIRTIPRVGYRWVAPVREYAVRGDANARPTREPAGAAAEPPCAVTIDIRTPRRARSHRMIAAAAVAALALCTLLLPLSQRAAETPAAAPGSIVLPATTAALPAEWSWLRFALADLIATRLSRGEFAAISSERVDARSGHPDAASLADTLQIQPEVTRVDGRWQVRLQARDRNGREFVGEGHGTDAMEAARRATDAFLDTMGYAGQIGDAAAGSGDPDIAGDAALQAALDAAHVAATHERYDEAADRLGEARTLAGSRVDRVAKIDVAFGTLLLRRQQPAMALPYLHRAIGKLDTVRGTPVLIDALTAIADANLALRSNDAALVAASRAWSFIATPDEVSPAAESLARALSASGNIEGANRLVDRLQPRTALEHSRLQALRARLALDGDEDAVAVDAAGLALTAEFAHADRAGFAHAWIDRIRALQRTGRGHEARIELQRLTRWCESACTSTHALRLALAAGQASAEQRADEALAQYANALRAADRSATPATQAFIAAAYLEALVDAHRMDLATAVAGRLTDRDLAGYPPRIRAAAATVRTWQETFLQGPGLARSNPPRERRHGIVR
jgi:DNA-binding winged helix-turn-helix (wHTH) protein